MSGTNVAVLILSVRTAIDACQGNNFASQRQFSDANRVFLAAASLPGGRPARALSHFTHRFSYRFASSTAFLRTPFGASILRDSLEIS